MNAMTRSPLAVLAVAALAVAGCGSSKSSSPSSGGTPAPSGGGAGATVKMQNIQFSPKSVTVKVGQTVTWTNEDSVDHNVTESGGAFQSKNFGKGGTFSFTPQKAGTFNYTCTIHSGMDGTLIVT